MPFNKDTAIKTAERITLKISVVGGGAVGKSSLLKKIKDMKSPMSLDYLPTLDVDWYTGTFNILGDDVILQFQDFPGQDTPRLKYARPIYYKGSVAALLLFDLTNKKTFDNLPKWEDELKNYAGLETNKIIYVGNKRDLTSQIAVTEDEFQKYVEKKNGLMGFWTSALDGTNVSKAAEAVSINALYNFKVGYNRWVDAEIKKNPAKKDQLKKKVIVKPKYEAELNVVYESISEPRYIAPQLFV